MAQRKVKFKVAGKDYEGWDVPIAESTDRWTEIRLEDGAVLRIKVVVSNVMRLENETDDQGLPKYAVKSTNALITVSGPTKDKPGAN